MCKKGLVSVVTATYNMGEYLSETLVSILNQEYEDIEFIVVDDGSNDNTQDVLDKFRNEPRLKAVYQKNSGQAAAKNRGIAEAVGEFIAFCDADDTWRKDKLSLQIPAFGLDDKIGVVFSDIACIDEKGKLLDIPHMKRSGGKITAALLIDNFVPFPTVVVRSNVIRKVGGFNENLKMSIDNELWLRISLDHLFYYLPEPLANYRVWEGQMSKNIGERLDNFFKLMEEFLEKHPNCVSEKGKNHAWAHAYVSRGAWHYSEGRRGQALSSFQQAMKFKFYDKRMWQLIAALLLRKPPRKNI